MRYIILLVISYSFSLTAQNYQFTTRDINSGLAHNNVFEIFEDREGYIWLGTGSYLQRFDGENFITFEHQANNQGSLSFGDIRSIIQDHKGNIWVGTDGGGVSVLENGTFKTYKKQPDDSLTTISSNVIEQVLIMPDSSIYFATWDNGIDILKDGKFSHLRNIPGDSASIPDNTVPSLLYDEATQRLWIGTWGGGLCYLINDQVHRVPIKEGGFNSPNARYIEKASDGSIWIGSWGNGVFRYHNGVYEHFNVANGSLENNNVLTLENDGNTMWIGTWGGGITRYENGQFKTFRHDPNKTNSIPSDFIESSLINSEGNLMIGTFGGGFTTFVQSNFEYTRFEENSIDQSSNFINSIEEDKEGNLWIASNAGVFIQDGEQFIPAQERYSGFETIKPAYHLFRGRNGDLWIGGGTGVGLYVFNGKTLIDKSEWPNIDFRDYFIFDINETDDGSYWISANVEPGLIQIKEDSVIRYLHDASDKSSIPVNNFSSTLQSSDGTLWLCSNRGGVITYKNGTFKQYDHDDSDPNSLSNSYAYHVLETQSGQIWIATEHGLNRYNPQADNFDTFFKKDGLLDNTILALEEDHMGYLWIATHRGVSRLDPNNLRFQNFDVRSGIQGYPFNRLAIFRSEFSNKIYVGGVNGLTSFHPEEVVEQLPSPVKVTNVFVNNRSVYFDNNALFANKSEKKYLDLKRFSGSMTFHFSNMNFGQGEELQYSYRISSLENSWNQVGDAIPAQYSNVPPGYHTFEVRSSLDGVKWSEADQVHFYINPFWWETNLFKVGAFVLILGAIWGLIYLRIQLLKRQKHKLAKMVDSKTAEISHQSNELAKTNADLEMALLEIKRHEERVISFQQNEREAIRREVHDSISSSLFSIRMLINDGLEKIKKVDQNDQTPTLLSELFQKVISDSRIVLKNLATSDELQHASFFDSLQDLVERSKQLSKINVKFEWNGPHHITELKWAANIFRIIQEIISNSLVHSQASNIVITFNNEEEKIQWCIEDDGIGFDQENILDYSGFQRIQNRVTEMGASILIQSKPGKGTRIEFSTILEVLN
jgi:ligand-binding sensor domain-containing protein/signal transduction histidine kinase